MLRIRWLVPPIKSVHCMTLNCIHCVVPVLVPRGMWSRLFVAISPKFMQIWCDSIWVLSTSQINLFKLFILDRNTWTHITVRLWFLLLSAIVIYIGLLLVTWNPIIAWHIWNLITVNKLLVLDKNAWKHLTVWKLLLDRKTWNHITMCKQMIIIKWE